MQGPTEYTCLQLPGAHDNTTEKNVDKIKIGDNIVNRSGKIVSGIVKWFSPEKGFGFITCSDGMDIFVYYTEIQTQGFKTLQKGQEVQLEIFSGERGPQASNVRLV